MDIDWTFVGANFTGDGMKQIRGWRIGMAIGCLAAAIGLARFKGLRFAAEDPKGGGVVHGARIFAQPTCHHRPDVLSGIGEHESTELLRGFFEERR